MYKLFLLPTAQNDIEEAAHWYNKKQKGLGKRFTTHIRLKVAIIQQDPRITATRYDNVRTAVLDTFPFMIHYLIDEVKETITIVAVLHTSRNPELEKGYQIRSK